jgi:hypothetical protein
MQSFKRHKSDALPYVPVEIWNLIIEWGCRMSDAISAIERSMMLVSWEWFDMTIGSLARLGMLVTRSESLVALIARRAIHCRRITIINPTQEMIRSDLKISALKIKILNKPCVVSLRDITDLDELSVRIRYGDDSIVSDIPSLVGLKKLHLRPRSRYWVNGLDLSVFKSLTHLVLHRVVVTDEMRRGMYHMHQLEHLKICDYEGELVSAYWLRSMVNLSTLVIPRCCLDDGACDVLREMTRLTKLDLKSASSDNLVRMPWSLEDLAISSGMNADLTNCSRLVKLMIDGHRTRMLSVMIERASRVPSLEYLRLNHGEPTNDALETIATMRELNGLCLNEVVSPPDSFSNLKELRHLTIWPTSGRDVGWLREMHNLESLKIGLVVSGHHAIEHINAMTSLRRLYVSMAIPNPVHRYTFAPIHNCGLQDLTLKYNTTSPMLGSLSMLTSLKSLTLVKAILSDDQLLLISKATTLEKIHIGLTLTITIEGVNNLLRMPRLRKLHAALALLGWQKAGVYCKKFGMFV